MKKLGKKIIVLAVVTVMGLSMIACGKKKSVEAYVKSSEVQEVLETTQSELSGTGLSVDITADGDKMVFTYTYADYEKADVDVELLEAGMEAQASTFQEMANEIKKNVSVDKPSVVLEYVDKNGELIYSEEFVAE